MRINPKNEHPDLRKSAGTSQSKRSADGFISSFFSTELKLREHEGDRYRQSIEQLRSELEAAGRLVEQDPTIHNFKKFRELLSTIAKQVSGEAYRLEKIGGTPSNPRYYEIITVIDKEADRLYDLIVREQKDRMAITASVIGIKGLVVDLIT